MFVLAHGGKTEAGAVNDGSVVGGVVEDEILATEQGGKHPQIDLHSRRKDDGFLLAGEFGEGIFQLDVQVESAVEEAGTGAAGAVLVHRPLGSFLELWMVGQPEVGVRAEHEDFAPVHRDDRVLVAFDDSKIGIHPGSLRFLRSSVALHFLLKQVHYVSVFSVANE